MKKRTVIIALFAFLLVIGITGTFWGPSMVEAKTSIWNSCPYGEVNDPYPGDCNRYIDTNSDGICDRSQPAPQAAASTRTPVSSALVDSNLTAPASGVISSVDDGVTVGDGNTSAVVSGSASESDTASNANGEGGGGGGGGGGLHQGRTYYFIPVVGAFIGLYAVTWVLSALKVFKVLTHRKIWNVVLLVSCLISAILGIILILNLDFGTSITLPFNTLFWHVEAGLAMAVIAVFHIIWHWRYWVKMLQIKEPAK